MITAASRQLVLVFCFWFAANAQLVAQTTHVWNDSTGGTWGTFSKWTPVGVPDSNDIARFNLEADYTVSFIASGQARLLQVLGGDVTFESSGIFPGDWTLNLEDAFIGNLGELLIQRDSNDRGLRLATSDDMTVRGALIVADGAELDNQPAVVDSGLSNSTARLTVSGVGPSGDRSTWNATELFVGNLARGAVRVQDRGFVLINGPATLGMAAGSSGEVIVNGQTPGGNASDFRTVGTLTIGAAGTGTFQVEDGGHAATGGAILGDEVGGRGTATIGNNSIGNPSFWTAGNLQIKRGDLEVNRSGSLRTTGATIGSEAPSSVAVSGAGTGGLAGRWNATGLTTISNSVDATVDIDQGGTVEAEEVIVGALAGGVGRINVSSSNPAAQSRWIQTGDLYLGGDSSGPGGVGHFNLNTNAYGRVDGFLTIYANSSVLMGPNSQLVATTIDNSNGGFFDFLRGTLNTHNFIGDLVNQEGTLAPYTPISISGEGPGLTNIDGNYTQQSGATLAIDISELGCGVGYDHVGVTGDAFLGGELQLTLIDDFIPHPVDTFNILSADSIVGQFDNVAPGARLSTTDGLGSFLVNYGPSSTFGANLVVLSDFTAAILTGDYDGNGLVGAGDLDLVLGAWGDDVSTTGVPAGWVNEIPTGLIGAEQLDGVLSNWGANSPRPLSVPEPTSVLWMLLATLGVVRAACRK